MRTARSRWAWTTAPSIAVVLLLVSCSSSTEDTQPPTTRHATTTVARRAFDPSAVASAVVADPSPIGGGSTILGPPGLDVSTVGYEQSERFLSGTAASYTSDRALSSDGHWDVHPKTTARYTTRIVVRRPADAARFNGTVFVEWLNVTGGLDASPDWTFEHTAMISEGAAWVGVTAQVVGIEGNGGPGSVLALKTADPVRYGSLVHPGDDYSYDIFSQAGAAVRTQSAKVLGGLTPRHVVAIGESQSAYRLTTYVNALALSTAVFDGYLLHSRGSAGAPLLLGTRVGGRPGSTDQVPPELAAPDPTFVRDDLDVPVLVFSSESDLPSNSLGYGRARQPDTDRFRGWEVAGTSHADAYMLGIGDSDDGTGAGDTALFHALSAPPSSIYGGIISCDSPINAGPNAYVLRAALRALEGWVRTGEPPPKMPRLHLDAAGTGYETDAHGNATGGIRSPQVDAPLAKLSGLGQKGESFCGLFGTTVPFDGATLRAVYPDHASFVAAWDAAVDAAVASKVLLPADAERLRSVAAVSIIGS